MSVIAAEVVNEAARDNPIVKGSEEAEKETKKSETYNELKDFSWDKFLLYIGSAIGILTFLDLSLEVFTSSYGLKCFLPTLFEATRITRDQNAYVDTFCHNSLTWNEYYSIFLLLQGIIITVPHFMWKVVYTGRFNFFVGLVKQLDRLRDGSTGDYRPINFAIIKKLEKEFKELRSLSIFTKYILKLIIQLIIIAGSLSVNIVVFKISDFTVVFECPSDFNDSNVTIAGWPYSFSVECTYPPFRILSKIQVMDYILLIFALMTVLYGLAMWFKRHRNALGHQDVADFTFNSFLSPEDHVFKRFQLFSPHIKDDLDFLLLKLFCTDTGHGRVFKDVQVCKKLDYLFREKKEDLHPASSGKEYGKMVCNSDLTYN